MSGWRLQGIRFVIVGLASNAVLYALYLLATSLTVGHKTAMTIIFAVGTLQTFVFNKRWTFNFRGALHSSFFKYALSYAFAYLLNLISMLLFVDHLDLPHQIVQGVMILTLAIILFLLQRYWVFSTKSLARPGTVNRDHSI